MVSGPAMVAGGPAAAPVMVDRRRPGPVPASAVRVGSSMASAEGSC